MNRDLKRRSLFKSLSWRITATLVTVLLVFSFTGQIHIAFAAGLIEFMLKLFLYYIHERLWSRSDFGKQYEKPVVIWLTGLSGSGKSTIAELLVRRFQKQGRKVEWLDGDVTREFIPTTGFSREERDRHVLSAGFLARTLEKNGINVVASYISPFRSTRESIRKMCRHFVEIHVAAPLSLCEERDVKGLYRKARSGEIKDFTGIDSPYEPPETPEFVIHTDDSNPKEAADRIMNMLKECKEL